MLHLKAVEKWYGVGYSLSARLTRVSRSVWYIVSEWYCEYHETRFVYSCRRETKVGAVPPEKTKNVTCRKSFLHQGYNAISVVHLLLAFQMKWRWMNFFSSFLLLGRGQKRSYRSILSLKRVLVNHVFGKTVPALAKQSSMHFRGKYPPPGIYPDLPRQVPAPNILPYLSIVDTNAVPIIELSLPPFVSVRRPVKYHPTKQLDFQKIS